jgi:hypothetical protein
VLVHEVAFQTIAIAEGDLASQTFCDVLGGLVGIDEMLFQVKTGKRQMLFYKR